jgi:hypothetical protein
MAQRAIADALTMMANAWLRMRPIGMPIELLKKTLGEMKMN